jgi:DNA-binding NtrC family response regulator
MDEMNRQILLVVGDISINQHVWTLLENSGYRVSLASNTEVALNTLSLQHFDILLVNDSLPDVEKLRLLTAAKRLDPELSVILASADRKVDAVVAAMKAGAADFLQEPIEGELLLATMNQVFEERRVAEASCISNIVSKSGFAGIITKSPRMQQIFELIERLSDTNSSVFITGETGVGKELIARAIHFTGARKKMPFVAINRRFDRDTAGI